MDHLKTQLADMIRFWKYDKASVTQADPLEARTGFFDLAGVTGEQESGEEVLTFQQFNEA